jgi:hypothetical protein
VGKLLTYDKFVTACTAIINGGVRGISKAGYLIISALRHFINPQNKI